MDFSWMGGWQLNSHSMLEVSERDAEEREADRAKQAQEELGDAIEVSYCVYNGDQLLTSAQQALMMAICRRVLFR